MKKVVWCGSQKIILLLLLWSLVFDFFMKVLVLLIKENINNYNIDLNISSALHLPPPGHWGKYYQMTQSANLTFKLLSSFSMAVIGAKVFMNINNNHHCKWISWQQILRYFYIQNIRIWYWPAAVRPAHQTGFQRTVCITTTRFNTDLELKLQLPSVSYILFELEMFYVPSLSLQKDQLLIVLIKMK